MTTQPPPSRTRSPSPRATPPPPPAHTHTHAHTEILTGGAGRVLDGELAAVGLGLQILVVAQVLHAVLGDDAQVHVAAAAQVVQHTRPVCAGARVCRRVRVGGRLGCVVCMCAVPQKPRMCARPWPTPQSVHGVHAPVPARASLLRARHPRFALLPRHFAEGTLPSNAPQPFEPPTFHSHLPMYTPGPLPSLASTPPSALSILNPAQPRSDCHTPS